MSKIAVFDFDSTLVKKESLDEVLSLAAKNDQKVIQAIEEVTNLGMEGRIDLSRSLEQRLELAKAHQRDFEAIGKALTSEISEGIPELIKYLTQKDVDIFIVSGGFLPCIYPTASILNIPKEHCFGSTYIKNTEGFIIDFDRQNPLSKPGGKIQAAQKIRDRYDQPIMVAFGDGYTDLELYLAGSVDHFIGYGVNQVRASVQEKAPYFFTDPNRVLELVQTIFP